MSADLLAVVPLRSPGRGKTRLAPDLDVDARAALAGAMLADVLAALEAAGVRAVVAAGGSAAAAAASALQAEVVVDGPAVRSLDDAIAHVRRVCAPRDGLLVVQADLPMVGPEDVRAVVEAATPVVVAPTVDGGTAALLRRPPDVVGTAFGPGSGLAHRRLARQAGVEVSVVDRPGLAHDVDVLADLQALDPARVGPATAAVLDTLDLDQSGCA